jgi:O-antigen/teichoic acid export membrane protein
MINTTPPQGARTIRNSALLLTARTLAKLAAFVVVVLQWNDLRSYRYGQFATLAVYVSLTSMVADLGLQTLYVREVARRPQDLRRYLDNLLSLRLFLMVPAMAALALAITLAARGLLPFLVAGAALLLMTSYATLLRATFYALGILKWEALAIFGEGLVLVAGALLTVQLQAGVNGFLWSYVAGAAFTVVFTLTLLAARGITPRWRLELRWLWGRVQAGLPFALAFVLSTLYFRVDVILLQGFTHNNWEVLGWYQGAYKYIDAVSWIPQTAMAAVFPVFAALFAQSHDRLRLAATRSYKVLLAIGLPIGVGMVLLGPALVTATRGLAASAPALQILGFAVILIFVNNAFIFVLTAIDRQVSFTWLATWSLVVNVALNLALIPGFSYLGASWATVLTEVFLFAGGWWLVRRHLASLPVLSVGLPLALAGLGEGLVLWPLRQGPAWLSVPVGAVTYVVGFWHVRAFTPAERSLVRQAAARFLPGHQ